VSDGRRDTRESLLLEMVKDVALVLVQRGQVRKGSHYILARLEGLREVKCLEEMRLALLVVN